MKRSILLLILYVSISFSCYAVKLVRGSLDCLVNESEITICMNLEKTTYRKGYPLKDFIDQYYRQENWFEESERCFTYQFNQTAYKVGLHSSTRQMNQATNYELQIVPVTIGKDGAFNKTYAYLIKLQSQEIVAEMVLDVDNGDIDDSITFRDSMRDAGEQLGEFFASKLKHLKPKEPKQPREKKYLFKHK